MDDPNSPYADMLEGKTLAQKFSSSLEEMELSLSQEGTHIDHVRSLLSTVISGTLLLEVAQEHSAQDGELIASLRHRLAECHGQVEAGKVRESHALQELARERVALGGATTRIAQLAGQVEGLRQMLAAAPRPLRPMLAGKELGGGGIRSRSSGSASGGGGSSTSLSSHPPSIPLSPFEAWRGETGRVRLMVEGGDTPLPLQHNNSNKRGLSPRTLKTLGHATTNSHCGGGGRAQPLGKGPVELVPHPFWSPHLYPTTPSSPQQGGGGEHRALSPSPPPPLSSSSSFPISLTHVTNVGRNGGGGIAQGVWREALEVEKKRFTRTQEKLVERGEVIRELRGEQ